MQVVPASLVSLVLLAPGVDGWLGLYLDNERSEAVVVEVIPDSPAAKAGLRAGDVLVAVGDRATPSREEFIAAVGASRVGDRLSIRLLRAGVEQVLVVALGRRPESAIAPSTTAPSTAPGKPAPAAEVVPGKAALPAGRGYLGISVRETAAGVVVDRVLADGPAKAAGLESGEVIVRAGDDSIISLADLDRVLEKSRAGASLALGLRGANGSRSVLVKLATRPAAATSEMTVAPVQPSAPSAPEPAAAGRLEAEVAALRAELADLRRQLEELRRAKGRE